MTDKFTKSWIRDASDELAVSRGCRFNPLKGAYAVWWIERHCKLYEGDHAGENMILRGRHDDKLDLWPIPDEFDRELVLQRAEHYTDGFHSGQKCDWQYECIMRLFGWQHLTNWMGKEQWIRRFRNASWWVPKKNKKPMALDTPIPTPSGWKTMEELQVGDQVFDENGQPCNIVGTSPVYTDEDCYKVVFSDGTAVVVGAGHEWYVQRKTNKRRWRVYETEEMFHSQKTAGRNNYNVWVNGALEYPYRDLPVDPYVLGCWLGDGKSSRGILIVGGDDPNGMILKNIRKSGGNVTGGWQNGHGNSKCHTVVGLTTQLKKLNLINNKHIPRQYLEGTIDQRTRLLNGLMDTDGCCGPKGQCVFVTISDALKDGMVELLRSLGFKPTVNHVSTKCDNYEGEAWRVLFSADETNDVFGMPRKQAKLPAARKPESRSFRKAITSIERVPKVPIKCISVDSESHLYLAGDGMVPTHNSPTLAAIGVYLTCGDGEPGQKVAFCAVDGQQAREITGSHVVQMVAQSVELQDECNINMNEMKLTHLPSSSTLRPFSSSNARTQKAKEGFNGSILVDETHVVDRDFMRRVKRAGISRKEPIQLEVSTAGTDPDGYGKEQFDYGADVAAGKVENWQFMYQAYCVDQNTNFSQLNDDNIIEIGATVNPAWGHTVHPAEFVNDWETSKHKLREQLDFMMYRLNVWQNSSSPWLPPGTWESCYDPDLTWESLRGRFSIVGFDKSDSRDFTAYACLFPEYDEHGISELTIWPFIIAPEDYIRRNGSLANFAEWVHSGELLVSEGDVIDVGYVYDLFGDIKRHTGVEYLAFDPHKAEAITQIIENGASGVDGSRLSQGHEVQRVAVNQRTALAEPINEFEALAIAGKIRHPGNRVFDWMMNNIHVKEVAGRKRLLKADADKDGVRKIDGPIAAVTGLALAIDSEYRPKRSVYEDRGLLEL